MPRPTHVLRRLRRAVLARRRLLAALCAGAAVLAALQAQAAPPPPRTLVLTAAHDLPAGVVVRPGDLRSTAYPPDAVPDGALARARAVGRTTTGPLRAGEPVTDARLVAASLLDGYPGMVAVPVRIGDPAAVRLLRVGDRVDLLAADPQGRRAAERVGRDVPVLAIPEMPQESAGLSEGALVVLAVSEPDAGAVAQASVTAFLSVVLVR